MQILAMGWDHLKILTRRWAHTDFGEGRGSHAEFWREVGETCNKICSFTGVSVRKNTNDHVPPVLESF